MERKKCEGCEKNVPLGSNKNARYCTDLCRRTKYQKEYRAKNKERIIKQVRAWQRKQKEKKTAQGY